MENYEYTPLYRAWAAIEIQGEKNWFAVLRKSDSDVGSTTQGQRDKVALKYAVRYVKDHPGQTALRCVVKFFDFWGLGGRADLRPRAEGLLRADPEGGHRRDGRGHLRQLRRYAVPRPVRDGRDAAVRLCPHLLLVLAMALIFGLHTLTFGHSRYHLPVMPLVMVYAAAAWADRSAIWVRRRQPAFVLARPPAPSSWPAGPGASSARITSASW